MKPAGRMAVRAAPGGGKVLVVDDNPATRYSTGRVLQAAGFTTCEAATGAQALVLAQTGVIAIVLDIHLPDMNGMEICATLRKQPQMDTVPILHLSAAYMMDDDKVRGLEGGADAYLTHPADPPLLVATINALMRARRAEQNLRSSDARFRAIYDLAPSGIALIDDKGRITDANAALLALLKRTADEVVGHELASFAPPGPVAALARHRVEQAQQGTWRGEFPLLDAQGTQVDVAWSLSAHVEPGAVLAIATDISERADLARRRDALLEREQAARAEAERTSRVKDEFIAVLSHELRTPLNAILTWSQLLQRSTAQLPRGLAVIERNARTQSRLIADILDVSRMDLGKLRLDLEAVDAAELVRSAVAVLEPSALDKHLVLDLALEDLGQPLMVDAARLQQILWNLLTNAIKFSPEGGLITVGLRRSGDWAELRVCDQGRGIPEEFVAHLFERFTQSDAASNRFHGGLGLGLAIVKHLAELHGGTAEAHSAGLDQGAQFYVRLPLNGRTPTVEESQESPTGFDESIPATYGLTGIRILLVEDDPDAREIAALILRDHGAQVSEAADVDAALREIELQRPDVLVSDIGLPGADGYQLMRQLRERERQRESEGGPRLHAIALTAFSRQQDRDAALAAGFDAHCGKPLRASELLNAIAQRPVSGN